MKKPKQKKVGKKVAVRHPSKRRATPQGSRHQIVVRVEAVPTVKASDLEPIKDGGKYMIPKTWMSERQVVRLVQNTPLAHQYKRPAKGGGMWTYVTGHYVEKVLNYTFGWNWDFEVTSHGKEGDQVWVLGKLTVKDDKGHSIIKTQFGRADIKFKTKEEMKNGKKVRVRTTEMLDFGNDLKAASTDSMKKAASLLGIASDIYGKSEVKAETGQDVGNGAQTAGNGQNQANPAALPAPKVYSPNQPPTYTICNGLSKSGCGNEVKPAEKDYSRKMFGKELCRDCQKKANPIRR